MCIAAPPSPFWQFIKLPPLATPPKSPWVRQLRYVRCLRQGTQDRAQRIESSGWSAADGAQRMERSGWSAADGAQRMERSGWSAADGAQRMERSGWSAADGAQRMERSHAMMRHGEHGVMGSLRSTSISRLLKGMGSRLLS